MLNQQSLNIETIENQMKKITVTFFSLLLIFEFTSCAVFKKKPKYICGNDIDYIIENLMGERINKNLPGSWRFIIYSNSKTTYEWKKLYKAIENDGQSQIKYIFKENKTFEYRLSDDIESKGTYRKGQYNTVILTDDLTKKNDTLTVIHINDKFLQITKSSEKDSTRAFVYVKNKVSDYE